MLKLIPAGAVFVASAAWGVGLAVGAFGGAAVPMGAMAGENVAVLPYGEIGSLGSSWMAGGKGLVSFGPLLELEAAAAYHSGHASEYWYWPTIPAVDSTTLVPVTAGANFKLLGGASPVYVSAGAGYYRAEWAYVGFRSSQTESYLYRVEVNIGGPGFYFGGGFGLGSGPFTLAFEPRIHFVLNEGDYTATYDANGATHEQELVKDYNDVYADLLFGVNYGIF
jgi:hypothetical protein